MTANEHIEETLNRAGQTISDLTPVSDRRYDRDGTPLMVQAALMQYYDDIIDRYDEALTRLCDLRDRHVHIVGNVDPPEGVTHEQLNACIEAIIDATEKYRAGLEPWDDWSVEDAETP